jgi:cbb3-type cytochrome oxidase subunit 1
MKRINLTIWAFRLMILAALLMLFQCAANAQGYQEVEYLAPSWIGPGAAIMAVVLIVIAIVQESKDKRNRRKIKNFTRREYGKKKI